MARFWQRTKDRLTAPAQYIQVTDSVSRPMAVMTTLVMFFVALAVLVSLFFVGKWGYDQIASKSSKPTNPVTGISTGINTDSKNSGNTATQTSGSTATVTSNGAGSAAVTPTQPSTTSVTPKTTTPSQPTPAPIASTVPNTGAGSTLGIFIVSSALGTLLYRFLILRRLT